MVTKNRFNGTPGRGVLMTNHKKRVPSSPDFTGPLVLDRDYKAGEKVQLLAWRKETRHGHLISLAVNTSKEGFGLDDERPYQGDLEPEETKL